MSGPARARGLDVLPFPSSRRAVTAAVRAGRRIMPMHGLVEVDVTEARRLLADHEAPLSTTAFVIAAVARAVAAHPEVHAYRNWRGRLVRHRHVDVQTIVEVPTAQGPFGLVHVVRDADIRGVADISIELSGVKADMTSTATGRALQRLAPSAGRVPGVFPAMYAVMSRSVRAHWLAGTVQVTAVGMFAGGSGFAIAPPTLASTSVVVGGLSRRPRVVGDEIAVRDVLDLTVTIDHNVVDGAPATRFGADLRHRMECPTSDLGLGSGT
jgi:pyruvate/2-oxoglutarate dehydrogenase complex dihydrolipoamide acyltransferase (E2) component